MERTIADLIRTYGEPRVRATLVRPYTDSNGRTNSYHPTPYRKFIWRDFTVITTQDLVHGMETILSLERHPQN